MIAPSTCTSVRYAEPVVPGEREELDGWMIAGPDGR
jgi:hypothetical protein